jgi:hypothetical protein
MLFIRFINRAVQAVWRSHHEGRKQARDSGYSPFRGPARGRSPRARISKFAPLQHAGRQPSVNSLSSERQLPRRLQPQPLRDVGAETDMEVGLADPHPVQNTCQLPRNSSDCAQHARPLGNPRPPLPQGRPFPHPQRKACGRLAKRLPNGDIALFGDAPS